MIVILTRDVKGTGKAGEVVEVSDGYARNLLIPKGYANEATKGNIKNLEKQKAIMQEKQAAELAAAEDLAKKISELTIEIKSKGGEGGRLFGSITSNDISEALEMQSNIRIDKKKIVLESPIKQTGETAVTVKVYPEVQAELKILVTL